MDTKLDKTATAVNANKFANKTMPEHMTEIENLIDQKIQDYDNAQPNDFITRSQAARLARRVTMRTLQ